MSELNGTPLWWQEEDIEWLNTKPRARGRGIFGHKTGMGKTFMTLAASKRRKDRRILKIGTKSSIAVWLNEVPKWTGKAPVHISRKTKNRQAVWEDVCRSHEVTCVIGYELFLKLIGKVKGRQSVIRKQLGHWDLLVIDEAHKKIRGRNTLTLAGLGCIDSTNLSILTATLVSKGPQDMWGALNLIDPKQFPSYWRFVSTFCFTFESTYGVEIGGVKDPVALKKLMSNYYKARGQEVRKQQAPFRQPLHLEMTDEQAKLYWEFDSEMLLEHEQGILIASNHLVKNHHARMLAICPRAVSPELPLGTLIEFLLDDFEDEPFTVVFSPFKAVLDVLDAELQKSFVQTYSLRGGMEPEEVASVVKRWKGTKGVMLCTIKFAESFRLDGPSVAYFLSAEYDPTLNIQAEGRMQDINTEDNGLTFRYLIAKDTVEEAVVEIIEGKVITVSRFMDNYYAKRRVQTKAT